MLSGRAPRVDATMASTLSLGGLSLGAGPMGACAALGCTDGLRVRASARAAGIWRAGADASRCRVAQAQAAPAHLAPLHTAPTAEVRVSGARAQQP